MNVAVIGFCSLGSYVERIASVLNQNHTAFEYPTQNYQIHDADGIRIVYPISVLLGNKTDIIDYIIVVQSKIMIHNDTDIPLLLFKTESVEPYCTVDNPTLTVKKLERLEVKIFFCWRLEQSSKCCDGVRNQTRILYLNLENLKKFEKIWEWECSCSRVENKEKSELCEENKKYGGIFIKEEEEEEEEKEKR